MGIEQNHSRWGFLSLIALVVLLALTLLYGCGGGGGDSDSSSGNGSSQSQDDSGSAPDDSGLPPDPGEAGKATLEGIDSDNDGIRDDVQRYLATAYSDSPKIKEWFGEVAKADQKMIFLHNDRERLLQVTREKNRYLDCIYIIQDDLNMTMKEIGEYKAILYNTNDRIDSYSSIQKALSGASFRLGGCEK
jgi:hypothetical protein